jgi:hypothetical protein
MEMRPFDRQRVEDADHVSREEWHSVGGRIMWRVTVAIAARVQQDQLESVPEGVDQASRAEILAVACEHVQEHERRSVALNVVVDTAAVVVRIWQGRLLSRPEFPGRVATENQPATR